MRIEFFIKNKNGQKISAVLYSKNRKIENKQTLIMCHGFTGYKKELWYPHLFSRLVKDNYQVISFDMNGHGKSYGQFIDFTISKAVSDFKAVYDYLSDRGVKRIGIMGHSIGGAACLLVANKIQIQSIILLSPVSQPDFYNKYLTPSKYDRDFLANFGFYPRHSFKRGKYYPVGLNFFKNFEKQPINEEARRIKTPFLLIHADQDEAVPLEDSQKLYNNLDFDVKNFKVIINSDHNFKKRQDYEQVIKLTIKWLNLYLKKGIVEVVNVMLRRSDGRFFIIKRSHQVGFFPDLWGGLGGFIHRGETIHDCARREIVEETGLAFNDLILIKKIRPYLWRDYRYDRLWRVHGLLYETKKTKLKTDWETAASRWVLPRQIKKYNLVPNQIFVFKKLAFK